MTTMSSFKSRVNGLARAASRAIARAFRKVAGEWTWKRPAWIDSLNRRSRELQARMRREPRQSLLTIDVCMASGDLPNADCPKTVPTWFIPGRSPIRVSTVHRRLRIDSRTGAEACAGTPRHFVREEVLEYWPSDLMQLLAAAGMPRRTTPPPGDCDPAITTAGAGPQILSPLNGVSYRLTPSRVVEDGQLSFLATADGGVRQLYWFVNDAFVGVSRPSRPIAWTPSAAGHYSLSVVDDHGRSDSRGLRVEAGG